METVRRQLFLPEDAPATGKGVKVAVLDTGIDQTHPDFAGRVNLQVSASFALGPELDDRNGHGTHISGIIGGSGAGSAGRFRGIAPECELCVFKVGGQRTWHEANAIRAIEAAIDVGAQVINFSHGYYPNVGDPPLIWPEARSLLEKAFIAASERGILCVVAAGNGGPFQGSISRPGGLEEVLTVGAIDSTGRVIDPSGRGPYRRSPHLRPSGVVRFDVLHKDFSTLRKPNIVAPGIIYAPRARGCGIPPGEDAESVDPLYHQMTGTSQAAAVVSGMAALVLELAHTFGIEFGPKRTRTLCRLFDHAASKLKPPHTPSDMGNGLVLWPQLAAVLSEFAKPGSFREAVLADQAARLME